MYKKIKKTCESCKKPYLANRPTQRFCSKGCVNTAFKTKKMKLCLYCEMPIPPHPSAGHCKEFCDRQCYADYRRKRQPKPCAHCGEIMFFGHSKASTKYCSKVCSQLAQNKKISLTCVVCDKEFKVSPCYVKRGQKCCSWDCANFIKKPYGNFKEKLDSGYRTSIEKLVENVLCKLQIEYSFEHRMGRYWVDFYLKKYSLALECDEPYWHNAERDAIKDDYIMNRFNIKVLRFTTSEIENDISEHLSKILNISRERVHSTTP